MNVLIAIQARTTSTRLPNKVMKRILGVTLIDNVINSCLKSSLYINRFSSKTGTNTEVVVLVPKDDPLKEYLSVRKDIKIIEGSEHDLISRYNDAMKLYDPDFICRITSDCFLIPPFLITKTINTAIKNDYDFTSTAYQDYRTFFDGADVEVCSRKLFSWLNENAKEEFNREHVFSYLQKNKPDWAKFGAVFSYLDLSALKLSIDTEEDLKLVTKQYTSIENKKRKFEETYGKGSAHMF